MALNERVENWTPTYDLKPEVYPGTAGQDARFLTWPRHFLPPTGNPAIDNVPLAIGEPARDGKPLNAVERRMFKLGRNTVEDNEMRMPDASAPVVKNGGKFDGQDFTATYTVTPTDIPANPVDGEEPW